MYRGSRDGSEMSGPSFFISEELFAKTYGDTSEYKLNVKNPLELSEDEWLEKFGLGRSPSGWKEEAEELLMNGHDSAVNIKNVPSGKMYVVFTISPVLATKIDEIDKKEARMLKRLIKIANKLDIIGCYNLADELDDIIRLAAEPPCECDAISLISTGHEPGCEYKVWKDSGKPEYKEKSSGKSWPNLDKYLDDIISFLANRGFVSDVFSYGSSASYVKDTVIVFTFSDTNDKDDFIDKFGDSPSVGGVSGIKFNDRGGNDVSISMSDLEERDGHSGLGEYVINLLKRAGY
jgi:hypothetical protein